MRPPDAVPSDAPPPRASPLALTALVTGLLGLAPLAIAFGVAALVRSRRGTSGGGRLAVGGLAAAAAWVVAWTVLVTLVVSSSGERDRAGASLDPGQVHVSALQAGDCYTWFGNEVRTALVTARPCDASHRGEIIALVPADAAEKLEGGSISRESAEALCLEKTAHLATSTFYRDIKPYVHLPEPGSENERNISCAAHYYGAGVLQLPLAETLEKDRTSYRDLRVGACVHERPEVGEEGWIFDSVKTLPCTEPHRYQVYAIFDVPYRDGDPDRIPSDEYIVNESEKGCKERLWERIDEVPGREYAFVPLMPTSAGWEEHRKTVCFVGLPDGTALKKSIVAK
ncbi:hypothetical protein GCM10010182_23000 [Actinomadura cremea]|nr:hypothetical protein GCM10010182_23000 [Actinomadura cremea]